MNKYNNHTFVICAYKESCYLEECIKSLENQTIKSQIIMVTSTPNEYIEKMAQKYNIELFVNKGESGIGPDWNFGVSCTKTDLVTIAHQDDIYNKNYLAEIIKGYEKDNNCSIIFGNYREIKNEEIIEKTKNLKIKRLCLKGLLKKPNGKTQKNRTIKYGNAICCPCVTLNTSVVTKKPFITGMKSNLDWYTWYEFSKKPNSFIYIDQELMCHRIHDQSETSNLIGNNVRLQEDYEMFKKFWPTPIAKFLMFFYKNAIKTNKNR